MIDPSQGPFNVIGVMSGSSLDGLDLALCRFENKKGSWKFEITKASTIPYSKDERQELLAIMHGTALELARLDRDLGKRIGDACLEFMQGLAVDLIASHGHTVFHRPDEHLTTQVGSGAWITAITGVPVINDFRTKDVALGGQGAPLVPFGEMHLFPDHQRFLNLGGIANVSVHRAGSVHASDVCPCNQVLDRLANELGKAYDDKGAIAAGGRPVPALLEKLNQLPFYASPVPRSLGREWMEAEVLPLIKVEEATVADRMHTFCEHIAIQVSRAFGEAKDPVLVTGGGAYNDHLVSRIEALNGARCVLPTAPIIEYKEAVIFAFLGLMRWLGESNVLGSSTGSGQAHISGALHEPD